MSREFMNGGSWLRREKKRPFFKRIRGDAAAGIRADQAGKCRGNALPNLTKFYGAGKGGIDT